jgi:hypothetical protein
VKAKILSSLGAEADGEDVIVVKMGETFEALATNTLCSGSAGMEKAFSQ